MTTRRTVGPTARRPDRGHHQPAATATTRRRPRIGHTPPNLARHRPISRTRGLPMPARAMLVLAIVALGVAILWASTGQLGTVVRGFGDTIGGLAARVSVTAPPSTRPRPGGRRARPDPGRRGVHKSTDGRRPGHPPAGSGGSERLPHSAVPEPRRGGQSDRARARDGDRRNATVHRNGGHAREGRQLLHGDVEGPGWRRNRPVARDQVRLRHEQAEDHPDARPGTATRSTPRPSS